MKNQTNLASRGRRYHTNATPNLKVLIDQYGHLSLSISAESLNEALRKYIQK